MTTINTGKDDAATAHHEDDAKEEEEESYGTPLVNSMDLVEEELANMSVSDAVNNPNSTSAAAPPTATTSLISPAEKSSRPKVSSSYFVVPRKWSKSSVLKKSCLACCKGRGVPQKRIIYWRLREGRPHDVEKRTPQ